MTNEKPVLLVLASTYPRWIGDSEPAFVHELNRRLAENFNIHVISPHAPGSKTFESFDAVNIHRFRYALQSFETLVQNGGILANLKKAKWKWLILPFFFLGMLIKTAKLLSHLKPQYIHVHWIIPQGLVMAFLSIFLKLPPMLLTSHGGDLFSLRGHIFIKLKAWVLSKFSLITVVSELMKEEAIKLGVPADKIQVIPMGVDFHHKFYPDFSMQRDVNEILFVGRLVEKKGVDLLIRVLPLVLEKMPCMSLTIAGYGPELNRLKSLTADLNIETKVNFMGAVTQDDLPYLYRRCGIFIAPFVEAKSGDQEGFPVSIVEAVACEAPLLTSRLPVLVDAFGILSSHLTCEVKDLNEFCDKIISRMKIQSDVAAARSLRDNFIDKLDWEVVANRYKSLLKNLGN